MTQSTQAGAAGADGVGARIIVSDLNKHYMRASGERVSASDNINVEVVPGEFLVLLGPSGCGKTTLLRSIAGLELPDDGLIQIDETAVFDGAKGVVVAVERRGIGMVFQSYALWPHMTALDNVAYPLRFGKGANKRTARARAREALTRVGLERVMGQYPSQMSGGQQQRVALARAIVDSRSLILFDEPLSNVDARERERLRLLLLDMHREFGFTAIYVTHDQVEAMELADRIAVMREGRIAQIGAPEDVYENPVDSYVAEFMGSLNAVPVRVRSVGEVLALESDDGVLSLPSGSVAFAGMPAEGETGTVIYRPEHVRIGPGGDTALATWEATVLSKHYLGSYREAILEVGSGQRVQVRHSGSLEFEAGDRISFHVDAKQARLLRAEPVASDLPETELVAAGGVGG